MYDFSILWKPSLQIYPTIPQKLKHVSKSKPFNNPMDSIDRIRSNNSSRCHHASTTSLEDLLSSAKVITEAAMSLYHHDIDKINRGRTAGAAADLLHAASPYGHVEDKPFGQYIEKAEDSLYQFHSSSVTTSDDEGHGDCLPATPKQKPSMTKQSAYPSSMYQPAPPKHVPKRDFYKKSGEHGYVASGNCFSDGADEYEGGSAADYQKLAQEILKEQGPHSSREDSEGGGFGEYMKLAQGLMKKY